ncbi:prefoldin subunit 6 isoform X2 [Syngnathus typhle]|uniref:prefoldin subunit 6 isoform X2 n=1 Tax=Syngnathus typhle TaxID=161592 RepID=UPI002A6B2CFD|nr:prefoldin subunit 6 isoform X2 [Syngnathus typhle]
MTEAIQKKLNSELEKYTQMQKDVSKSMSARQKLETQLAENNIVKEELDLLDSANTVFKLIGPVLVKQDLDEAKATVTKRLEYINGEITVTGKLKLPELTCGWEVGTPWADRQATAGHIR